MAIDLFNDLLKYSYDGQAGGFFEAFDRKWQPMDDLRLSEKDATKKKQ